MTDTKKLREKISRSGIKITRLAEKVGLTYQGFTNKLNNRTDFTASEIKSICDCLGIGPEERDSIFFAG